MDYNKELDIAIAEFKREAKKIKDLNSLTNSTVNLIEKIEEEKTALNKSVDALTNVCKPLDTSVTGITKACQDMKSIVSNNEALNEQLKQDLCAKIDSFMKEETEARKSLVSEIHDSVREDAGNIVSTVINPLTESIAEYQQLNQKLDTIADKIMDSHTEFLNKEGTYRERFENQTNQKFQMSIDDNHQNFAILTSQIGTTQSALNTAIASTVSTQTTKFLEDSQTKYLGTIEKVEFLAKHNTERIDAVESRLNASIESIAKKIEAENERLEEISKYQEESFSNLKSQLIRILLISIVILLVSFVVVYIVMK